MPDLRSTRAWLRRWWFGGPVGDQFVHLPTARELREIEFQQQIDQQSGVGRTSRQCRTMPRRRIAGVIERVRKQP